MLAPPATAQVVRDGSIGPDAGVQPEGPDYRISPGMGEPSGNFLFHSFSELSFGDPESVHFEAGGPVTDIVARVTEAASTIDGRLGADASLYLVNPAGILFGPGARLDVDGSFRATTADGLVFSDGQVFFSRGSDAVPVLSLAEPPPAFGFLSSNRGEIDLLGSDLAVPEGETLGLVANAVTLRDASLFTYFGPASLTAPGGRIEVIARNGSVRTDGFASLFFLGERGVVLDVGSAARNGQIVIRGTDVLLFDTELRSRGGAVAGAPRSVDLQATGRLSLLNALVDADGTADGAGGAIRLSGREVALSVDTEVRTGFGNFLAAPIALDASASIGLASGAQVLSAADGQAGGAVTLAAPQIRLEGDARVFTASFGAGTGGEIAITLPAEGRLFVGSGAAVIASSSGAGETGRIRIVAPEADVEIQTTTGSISLVQVVTQGPGDTGGVGAGLPSLEVQARNLLLDGGALGTASRELGGGGPGPPPVLGRAGQVRIDAGSLRIVNGGALSTEADATGDALGIEVEAETIFVGSDLSRISTDSADLTLRGGVVEIAAGLVLNTPLDLFLLAAPAASRETIGTISVDVDRLTVRDGGVLSSATLAGRVPAGDVVIRAREEVEIEGVAGAPSQILSITLGAAEAGDIDIQTPRLRVVGEASIAAGTADAGNGGSLRIRAGELEVLDGAGIRANTIDGAGDAGIVDIRAGRFIRVEGTDPAGIPSSITSITSAGSGDAGAVRLEAPRIEIRDGALVATSSDGRGDAGPITLDADRVEIRDGGGVRSDAFRSGDGGAVEIRAEERVEITGPGSRVSTEAFDGSTGAAGRVAVEAPQIRIEDGALVSASTQGAGAGGDVTLRGALLRVGEGAEVVAASTGRGDAGQIGLFFEERIDLVDAAVRTEAARAAGGNIAIRAGRFLTLTDASISTSVTGGAGAGGNIDIDPDFVILEDGGRIVAQATEGRGGNIALVAGLLLVEADGEISASSQLGIDGQVNIDAGDTDLVAELIRLPERVVDAGRLLRERCAARRGGETAGSFVVAGRDGLPPEPDGLLSVSLPDSLGGDAGLGPGGDARGSAAPARVVSRWAGCR